MDIFDSTNHMVLRWSIFAALGTVGALGLLAILSPRLFSRLAAWSAIWVDTDRFVKKLDRRIDVDRYVLRWSRFFGLLVVAATAVLLTLAERFGSAVHWSVWLLLGTVGGLGVLATLSPRAFSQVAGCSSTWIDTERLTERLDRRFDIERYVLRCSRLFGGVIVALVLALAAFAL